jgi:hypothetical protein
MVGAGIGPRRQSGSKDRRAVGGRLQLTVSAGAGPEAGRLLRKARQQKRASIEAAAEQLTIPPAQLQALEEGDLSGFTAEVYVRGAYMQYATWLGLDPQHAQRVVSKALRAARQHKPLRVHTPQRLYERLLNPRTVIFAGGGVVALMVGGYILWQVQSFWQLPVLVISDPPSDIIQDSSIIIRGYSEPQARVRVNEEPILLEDDASFAVRLELHPGVNVLRVEAANAAGRTRVVEKHLLRPRSGAT